MDVLVPENTSDYTSIKKQLSKAKRDVSSVEDTIKHNKEDMEAALAELNDLDSTARVKIEEERERQLNEHIDECVKPINDKLAKVNANREKANQRYNDAMNDFDNPETIKKYMTDISSLDELDSVVDEIGDAIAEAVGEEFKDKLMIELTNALPNKKISPKKLKVLKVKLERALEDIQSAPKESKLEVLNDLSDFLDNLDSPDSEGPKGEWLVFLIAFMSVGAIFLTKYIAPIYIVFLTGIFSVNYYRHTRLFKNAILFNSISNNIDGLREQILVQARKMLEKDRAEYEASYDAAIRTLDRKEEELQIELSLGKEDAKGSFVFNQSSVDKSIEQLRIQRKTRVTELKRTLEDNENQLQNCLNVVKDLEEKLEASIEYTKNQYLDFDKVGESFLLNPSFLIDIKSSGQPIIWNFPETNILVISNDEMDYPSFTGLIVAQLRNRLSPFALKITIVDSKGAGIQYQHLVDSAGTVGKIVTSDKDFRDEMLTIVETQEARVTTILREFSGIAEYNSYMLSIDSIAESYKFYFVPLPSESLLTDPVLSRILNVCYKVGIYFIFYMKQSDLTGSKGSVQFIDVIQNFYVLENGQLGKWAKSFVQEMLAKKE